MNYQHPEESILLAYADKRLDATERAEVEQLLNDDPEAKAFLELLERSDLPFKAAFDAQLETEVPEETRELIEGWPPIIEQKPKNHQLKKFGWAASLVVGLLLGYSASTVVKLTDSTQETPTWLAQVASYHELYVRETVQTAQLEQSELLQLRKKLGNALDHELTIPDLQAQDLTFKRGQILQIEGRPLIQLAYLPDNGTPVALCITRNEIRDHSPVTGVSHGLHFVSWASEGLSYVLLGSIPPENLSEAAKNATEQLL